MPIRSGSSRGVALLGFLVAIAASALPARARAQTASGETSAAGVTAQASPTKNVPYRNSILYFGTFINTTSFAPASQLTYDPFVELWWSLRPRYYLTDKLSLRGRLDLSVEVTNADDTTFRNEPILSDTYLNLSYAPLYETSGFKGTASLLTLWPTSKASAITGNMYAAVGLGTGISRDFHFLGKTTVGFDALGYGFFRRYSDSTAAISPTCSYTIPPQFGGGGEQAAVSAASFASPSNLGCAGGSPLPQFRFMEIVSVDIEPVHAWNLSLTWLMRQDVLAPQSGGTVPTLTGGQPIGATGGFGNFYSWLMVDVGHEFAPWLDVSAGFSTYSLQLAPDSTYYNPIFNITTQVFVLANFKLAELAQALRSAPPAGQQQARR